MKTLLLLLLLSPMGFAQSLVRLQPDCILSFTIQANGNSSNFDNRFSMCDNWAIDWETYGATPAATITFQGARSTAAGTLPGTYATFSGTTITGSNPSTSLAGAFSAQGFSPWVRLNVAGLSGSVRGQILGCRLPCSLSSGGGGGPTANVNVQNFPATQNVLQTAVCNQRLAFSVSASGNTQILAAVGGQTITVCHISMSYASSVDWSLTQGTGTNCATGNALVTGAYSSITGVALDRDISPIALSVSQALCVNNGSAVIGGGLLIYKQN